MASNPPGFSVSDFGRNLRRVRQEQGRTQEEVAEQAGVSPRYVALIEAGARNPTLGVILLLASALGVQPARLFKT